MLHPRDLHQLRESLLLIHLVDGCEHGASGSWEERGLPILPVEGKRFAQRRASSSRQVSSSGGHRGGGARHAQRSGDAHHGVGDYPAVRRTMCCVPPPMTPAVLRG